MSGKAEDVPKLPAGNPVNGVAAEGGEPQGAAHARPVLTDGRPPGPPGAPVLVFARSGQTRLETAHISASSLWVVRASSVRIDARDCPSLERLGFRGNCRLVLIDR